VIVFSYHQDKALEVVLIFTPTRLNLVAKYLENPLHMELGSTGHLVLMEKESKDDDGCKCTNKCMDT